MRNSDNGLGVISAFVSNEEVAARPPKAVVLQEWSPAPTVEFSQCAFDAFNCHIAQSHSRHPQVAVTSEYSRLGVYRPDFPGGVWCALCFASSGCLVSGGGGVAEFVFDGREHAEG